MDEKEYYARHLRNMRRSSRRIRAMLEKSYANLGREIASQKFVSPATFAWSKNVKLTKRVDLILGQQNFRLKNEITRSIISEWKLASQKNDELVKNYIGDTYVYHKARKELFQANTEALNAFILRTDTKQFNLSKRVWNLTNGTKTQLKYHIGQGIATGKGAAEISRDIRNVLVEPNRLYRRVRDKTGKLVLSKPAKLYKPGSGAYRSSYKNALRLAVTETNMAYRASDHIRRAQLPFIVGYKVNLSGSHPMTDICDDMKGVYPKEFRFVGWHPHCLCYTTAILMEKKKFVKYLKTGKLDKRMYVNKIPIKAERYVNKHATKIAKLKNKPYWTENFNKDLKLKSSIGKMRSFEEMQPIIPEKMILDKDFPKEFNQSVSSLSSDESFATVMSHLGSNMTKEQFFAKYGGRENARKMVKRMMADTDVYTSMDSNLFVRELVKKEGKFKNSLETGKGTFKTIGEARSEKEKFMFGITKDVAESDAYPKYGFVSSKGEMTYENIVNWGYGDTYIQFNRGKIANRTSITIGDSFDGTVYNKLASGKKDYLRTAPSTMWADPTEDVLLSGARYANSEYKMKMIEKLGKIDDFGAYMDSYVEAQIYGELTLADVEVIYVSSIKQADKIKLAFQKMNIKHIAIKASKYDDRVKALWDMEYSGKGGKYVASLRPEDIDKLGDVWIDRLQDRWMKTAVGWMKNSKKFLPKELMPGLRKLNQGTLSKTEARNWLREFYKRIAQKENGGLPKVWWEDYRSTYSGWLDDVFNKSVWNKGYK